jgi:hypothetical protein
MEQEANNLGSVEFNGVLIHFGFCRCKKIPQPILKVVENHGSPTYFNPLFGQDYDYEAHQILAT